MIITAERNKSEWNLPQAHMGVMVGDAHTLSLTLSVIAAEMSQVCPHPEHVLCF